MLLSQAIAHFEVHLEQNRATNQKDVTKASSVLGASLLNEQQDLRAKFWGPDERLSLASTNCTFDRQIKDAVVPAPGSDLCGCSRSTRDCVQTRKLVVPVTVIEKVFEARVMTRIAKP